MNSEPRAAALHAGRSRRHRRARPPATPAGRGRSAGPGIASSGSGISPDFPADNQGGRMAKKSKKNKADDEGNSTPDRLELTRKAFEAGALRAPGRADPAAGLGGGRGCAGHRRVRGARHGRQGRRDQADHRALQPARVQARGAAGTLGPREEPALHPALRRPLSRPRARSSCSTAPGTTAPASSG